MRELVPWRFVGGADGTVLSYDPNARSTPERLDRGEVVTFFSSDITSVRSQDADHPFYAGVFMTGSQYEGAGLGDPDFVNVVPSAQFLDHYVFFADHTYQETVLTVVRRKTGDRFAPVELDCAGELADCQPIGDAGEYEHAWVPLTSVIPSRRVRRAHVRLWSA